MFAVSLEVNPSLSQPPNEFLTRICKTSIYNYNSEFVLTGNLQGVHNLAQEYNGYANSTTPLQVELLICIDGIAIEQFTGTPSCGHDDNHAVTPASTSPPHISSLTGVCITLQVRTPVITKYDFCCIILVT